MELERLPRTVIDRARELVGFSGELLDPELAVLVALSEEEKFPVPVPGVHDDMVLGAYGEITLVEAMDDAGRDWEARSGATTVRVRFEDGAPSWADAGATMRFVGAERDPRDATLLRVSSDTLAVPTTSAVRLDPGAIEPGLNDVTLQGRLLGLDPTRSFSRSDGSMGFVARARIGTPVGSVEVTCWDEHIRPLVGNAPGTRVKMTGLYTKDRRGKVEVHTGRNAMVEILTEDD